MQFHILPIAEIVINRDSRQRREISTEDLEKSISKRGLLQPIIIQRDTNLLVAGERRLEACRNLGHDSITVRYLDELSPLEAKILEFEENNKRKDLTWQETIQAIADIHQLFMESSPESWTREKTSAELGISQSYGSICLIIAPHLSEERIAKCNTYREAYNLLRRREQRKMGDALQELLSDDPPSDQGDSNAELPQHDTIQYRDNISNARPSHSIRTNSHVPPPSSIIQADFLSFAPSYSGPKFNLLHCDFPYGISNNSGPQGQQGEDKFFYQDTQDTFFSLLDCLCDNFWKLMSVSGHMIFWYSRRYESEIISKFNRIPTLKLAPFPLIWHKTDNVGIIQDVRRWPRHTYETALFASIGDRQVVQPIADSIGRPTDNKLHPSTKPEPVCQYFLQSIVDSNTRMLDPTCGSGAALRAADSLAAKSILGLEIDPEIAHLAEVALSNSRKLRGVKMS